MRPNSLCNPRLHCSDFTYFSYYDLNLKQKKNSTNVRATACRNNFSNEVMNAISSCLKILDINILGSQLCYRKI